jgi:hypothetical protein
MCGVESAMATAARFLYRTYWDLSDDCLFAGGVWFYIA